MPREREKNYSHRTPRTPTKTVGEYRPEKKWSISRIFWEVEAVKGHNCAESPLKGKK